MLFKLIVSSLSLYCRYSVIEKSVVAHVINGSSVPHVSLFLLKGLDQRKIIP